MHDVVLDALAKGGGGSSAAIDTWLSGSAVSLFIPIAAIAGILFGLLMWWRVSQISVGGGSGNREYLLEGGGGDEEVRGAIQSVLGGHDPPPPHTLPPLAARRALGTAAARPREAADVGLGSAPRGVAGPRSSAARRIGVPE